MAIVKISSAEFDSFLKSGNTPLLLDIWAPWCGPCVVMAPLLEGLSDMFAGRIRFAKSNVDENPDLASRFSVMSIPSMLLFENGLHVSTVIGATTPDYLIAVLDKLAKS